MASTDGPPSQRDLDVTQLAAPGAEESSPSFDLPMAASPAPSGSSGVPDLTRSVSTPSSDVTSMRSHTSIPVVGTFPLGSLRVHKAMDSPRTQRSGGLQPESIPDMPLLEGDDAEETGALASALSAVGGGDVFLILDLPPNATVGCDARAIGTGASGFQGVCDIPPGPHFIWVAEPGAMSRCGYWFVTKDGVAGRGEVRVKQWDKFNEVLVDPASDFEARDHKANVASLYPQLVPYGYFTGRNSGPTMTGAPRSGAVEKVGEEGEEEEEDTAQLWRRLTACISDPLLARVTGKPANAGEFLFDTSDSAAGDGDGFPQARTTQLHQALAGAGELHFLFPEGDVDLHAIGDQQGGRQQQPPDTSDDILRLVDTPGTGVAAADLVGELQLAFLAGLHLGNLSCVEQWWHLLLRVVLRAHRLALLRPDLCRALLETFHAQMIYDDKYMSSSSLSSSSSGAAAPAARDGDDGEDGLAAAAAAAEYGGPAGGGSTSVLDLVPGNRRRLRSALTLYKRRLGELLLDLPPGGDTAGQGEVGRVFVGLEAWFWRFGWDLRTDYVAGVGDKKSGSGRVGKGRGAHGLGEMGNDDDDDDDDDDDEDVGYGEGDEYRPVIVDLDEDGREVGLVSFN